MRRALLIAFVFATALMAQAQQDGVPNAKKSDPPNEFGKFKKNCPFTLGCAEVLFTGDPLHIAVGTIAPGNGIAAGLAIVGHKDKQSGNWSFSLNADAVASANHSWRAGVYFKIVDDRGLKTAGVRLGVPKHAKKHSAYVEQPVYTFYAQSVSLNKLAFFGEGYSTLRTGQSFFGMTEHIVGASAVRPFANRFNFALYGEANGRIVSERPDRGETSGSVEQVYSPVSAPGLGTNVTYAQLGGGARLRPTTLKNLLHFDYDLGYRPYFATGGTSASFQRLTINAYQEISLHHSCPDVPRESSGPDDRVDDTSDDTSSGSNQKCPRPGLRSQQGSLGFRIFDSMAMTRGNNAIPFYMQPTLGGSDINGNQTLASYQDYRFRAPDILLLRESFEHSVGKLPLGIVFFADQAKLGMNRADLGASPWLHSYAAGLTLRAGGFPQVYLLFAFGGKEGTHNIVNVNTGLLGSSSRPALQ